MVRTGLVPILKQRVEGQLCLSRGGWEKGKEVPQRKMSRKPSEKRECWAAGRL